MATTTNRKARRADASTKAKATKAKSADRPNKGTGAGWLRGGTKPGNASARAAAAANAANDKATAQAEVDEKELSAARLKVRETLATVLTHARNHERAGDADVGKLSLAIVDMFRERDKLAQSGQRVKRTAREWLDELYSLIDYNKEKSKSAAFEERCRRALHRALLADAAGSGGVNLAFTLDASGVLMLPHNQLRPKLEAMDPRTGKVLRGSTIDNPDAAPTKVPESAVRDYVNKFGFVAKRGAKANKTGRNAASAADGIVPLDKAVAVVIGHVNALVHKHQAADDDERNATMFKRLEDALDAYFTQRSNVGPDGEPMIPAAERPAANAHASGTA